MRIIIDILHPAHVHFFKNFIKKMTKKGHEILITAREKDVTIELLKLYGIRHYCISKLGKGFLSLPLEWIKRNIKFYFIAKKFKPDLIIGIMGATIAPMGKVLRVPSIIFWDTEHTKKLNNIIFRLATLSCVPTSFKGKLCGNFIKYKGYHELAYLHPKRFKPNLKILKRLGLKNREKFVFVRFTTWEAIHDLGVQGIKNKKSFVNELEKYGKVFISHEGKMPVDLEKYKIKVPITEVHHLLYYTNLYIGDGGTMASEAAVLGTPTIFTGTQYCGYINEQADKYGLSHIITSEKEALEKAKKILLDKNSKQKYRKKREIMLKDKIDVTDFMIKKIEEIYENL